MMIAPFFADSSIVLLLLPKPKKFKNPVLFFFDKIRGLKAALM
jgi:hypothetical protein